MIATGVRLRDLTEAARNGKAGVWKTSKNGTFTISNHGVSGSLLAAPIILANSQAAILGAGKLQKRAVVIDDAIQVKPMMYVTLTIDHRVLDAQQTNAFLSVFVGSARIGKCNPLDTDSGTLDKFCISLISYGSGARRGH